MVYLDNAATSFPKPKSVICEVCRCMREYCGNPGRGSHRLSVKASEKIYECREEAARLFGAEPGNVAFTCNTTYALNIAIRAFVRPSDRVLISNMDHNSVIRPIKDLCRRGLISFDVFEAFADNDAVLADIAAKIRPDTSVLICSAVSNVCSRRLPLEDISDLCRKNDIKFVIDAAQSAGVTDTDISLADAVCAPGHKGLLGPQGTALTVFSNRYSDAAGSLPCLISGGGGINSLDPDMPDFLPERFEAGTLNTPGIAGLCEGIRFVNRLGTEEIYAHESALGDRLREMLGNSPEYILYDPAVRGGGTVLFNKKGVSPSRIAAELDAAGICVRAGFQCSPLAHERLGTGSDGAVRASFGIFNRARDAETLWRALGSIV